MQNDGPQFEHPWIKVPVLECWFIFLLVFSLATN